MKRPPGVLVCVSKRSRYFLVHVMSPGGGELSLSVFPGVRNKTSSTQMPGGVPGGMVTGRIEPRINTLTELGGSLVNENPAAVALQYLHLLLIAVTLTSSGLSRRIWQI